MLHPPVAAAEDDKLRKHMRYGGSRRHTRALTLARLHAAKSLLLSAHSPESEGV